MKTEVDKVYPYVVMILSHDDGEEVPKSDRTWCYITNKTGNATLCGGEFFGMGESGCDYKTKQGKITCKECISIIKEMKRVKL